MKGYFFISNLCFLYLFTLVSVNSPWVSAAALEHLFYTHRSRRLATGVGYICVTWIFCLPPLFFNNFGYIQPIFLRKIVLDSFF